MFKWGKRAVDAAAAVINEIKPAEQEMARQTLSDIEQVQKQLIAVRDAIHKVIFGQRTVVDQCLITLLAGGHAILVGVPGVAKTTLVEITAAVMGLEQKRVQATPDLMPSDILGSEVLDTAADGMRNFRFIRGPVFCQLLLMDEINRASPRTQAALLQAMQEQRVTIAGRNYNLPKPFHVFATQNPLEYEGTYPLPEAQLDRFMMQINISYPAREAEKQMLLSASGAERMIPHAVIDGDMLERAQQLAALLPVGHQVVDIILELVRRTRPDLNNLSEIAKHIHWGPGPRGAQALLKTARAKALLEGRLAPSIDDIRHLAVPVLEHRMQLTYAARADGMQISDIIRTTLDDILA
jgi:MoxR-like ATPase